MLSSNWPERPTNGSPAISSSRPGASPTNITLACGLPSANTSRFAVRRSAQPSNRSSRSRSASRLVAEAAARRAAIMAASGAGGASSPVPPPPAGEGREGLSERAFGMRSPGPLNGGGVSGRALGDEDRAPARTFAEGGGGAPRGNRGARGLPQPQSTPRPSKKKGGPPKPA